MCRGSEWQTHWTHVSLTVCTVKPLLCPDRREGGNMCCFCPSVSLSVGPSVTYIANNSRTQRTSVPKLGTKVPHLRWLAHQFQGQTVKGQGYRRRGHTVSAESTLLVVTDDVCWSIFWSTARLSLQSRPISMYERCWQTCDVLSFH